MRRHTAIVTAVAVTALLGMGWPGASGSVAAPGRAGNSPWTGTFHFVMHQDYSADFGGASSDLITADCTATIIRHADGTASATATYSYDETRIEGSAQSGNQRTTKYHVPSTTASFPQWGSPPYFALDSQGGYSVSVQLPGLRVLGTETDAVQGSTPTTQAYDRSEQCDPQGGETGTGTLQGGATVTGSKTGSLLNGTKITLDWTIQDSTLPGAQSSPTKPKGGKDTPIGKITVTNHGIDATLDWMGWELGYSGDWKATQEKPGAPPQISSPDQKVTITVQEQPVGGGTKQGTPQSTIRQVGRTAGGIKSVTFKPFAIGKLTGQIGAISLANSPDTLLVVVVGDGQHVLIAQIRARPNTPPSDLLQAGMAIGSIHPTR